MRLELSAHKVRAIRVHRVDGYEAIRVGGNHISVWLKLYAGDMRTRWLLHDIGALKEAILAAVPESQVSSSVGDDQIIVERMEGRAGETFLKSLEMRLDWVLSHFRMRSMGYLLPPCPAGDPIATARRIRYSRDRCPRPVCSYLRSGRH